MANLAELHDAETENIFQARIHMHLLVWKRVHYKERHGRR
jgi:hypothetical protein